MNTGEPDDVCCVCSKAPATIRQRVLIKIVEPTRPDDRGFRWWLANRCADCDAKAPNGVTEKMAFWNSIKLRVALA